MDKHKRHLKEVQRKYWRRKHKTNTLTKVNSNLPRFVVQKSNKYHYAIIVDRDGRTLVQVSDVKTSSWTQKVQSAFELGKKVAELALAKGVKEVVFDRNGYLYHGRVKAIAEGAREGWLKF